MKGKTNTGVEISKTEMLVIGTEVEIVDVQYGCYTSYVCKIPSGKQIPIEAYKIDITDYTPPMDWDRLRIELASKAMQGILSNEENTKYACMECRYDENEVHTIPKAISQFAVACADALIEELKSNCHR